MYHTLIPAVHLLFVEQGNILLLKRLNTGYHDGDYSLPAGHIEANESVIAATIREAAEELGITISPSDLTIVQVMHRKSSPYIRKAIQNYLHKIPFDLFGWEVLSNETSIA